MLGGRKEKILLKKLYLLTLAFERYSLMLDLMEFAWRIRSLVRVVDIPSNDRAIRRSLNWPMLQVVDVVMEDRFAE